MRKYEQERQRITVWTSAMAATLFSGRTHTAAVSNADAADKAFTDRFPVDEEENES